MREQRSEIQTRLILILVLLLHKVRDSNWEELLDKEGNNMNQNKRSLLEGHKKTKEQSKPEESEHKASGKGQSWIRLSTMNIFCPI